MELKMTQGGCSKPTENMTIMVLTILGSSNNDVRNEKFRENGKYMNKKEEGTTKLSEKLH